MYPVLNDFILNFEWKATNYWFKYYWI